MSLACPTSLCSQGKLLRNDSLYLHLGPRQLEQVRCFRIAPGILSDDPVLPKAEPLGIRSVFTADRYLQPPVVEAVQYPDPAEIARVVLELDLFVSRGPNLVA